MVAVASLLVVSAPAQARKHHPPPTFAGLQSATTCMPVIGPRIRGSYHLAWEAASAEGTPADKIVYEIYRATTRGGENFSRPTYAVRGVTSFDTRKLSSIETFFFVVRARAMGAEDSNTVEKEGQDLCV